MCGKREVNESAVDDRPARRAWHGESDTTRTSDFKGCTARLLDRLDQYMEQVILPRYNHGRKRAYNSAYDRVSRAIQQARREGQLERVRELIKERRSLPAGDPFDPEYRRLRDIRYAVDFLLGFVGPKAEAEEIMSQLKQFLHDDLKLELSEAKALITHATTERARFLGYEIRILHDDTKIGPNRRRTLNGGIGLNIPHDVIEDKCAQLMKDGKTIHRTELMNDSDYSIVTTYQQEYCGVAQYYVLAHNLRSLARVHHIMQESLLKNLAKKHKTTVMKVWLKYRTIKETEHGTRKCLRVTVPRDGDREPLIAEFGGIPLRRKSTAYLHDTIHDIRFVTRRTDIIRWMMSDICELCGVKGGCEVHHVRKLASLYIKGRREKSMWMKRVIALRRKTLVVCKNCHTAIHAGWPLQRRRHRSVAGEPDDAKVSRPVRRGADGKGAA